MPGADLRFVRGDVRPVHREMAEAAGGKNVWLVGGGELVGQFHDHGLLNLELDGGTLDSHGRFEYAPKHREARIADVTVSGLRLDYVHSAATAAAEKERAAEAARVAQDDQPPMLVRLERFQLADSVVGLINRAADRPYRVFVDGADLVVTNISSGFQDGPAVATSSRTGRAKRSPPSPTSRARSTTRTPAPGRFIVRPVSNAFVRAILPGFDREFEAARRGR